VDCRRRVDCVGFVASSRKQQFIPTRSSTVSGSRLSCLPYLFLPFCCHTTLASPSRSTLVYARRALHYSGHNYYCCCYCLSSALHSCIGQNIKSLACPVSGLRCPVRVWKTPNGHISATRHPINFVLGSTLGFFSKDGLALNLTAQELHELYYDRPTS